MDEFEAVYLALTIDINICDHEQMNAEFARFARHVWNESARRADKCAREECAEICDKLPEKHFNVLPDECAKAIRATIKEDKLNMTSG